MARAPARARARQPFSRRGMVCAMAKRVLEGIDWENSSVLGDDAAPMVRRAPVVLVPETPPANATMQMSEVCKTLNLKRGGVRRYVELGRLVPVSKSQGTTGRFLYDRAQVEELAADLEAKRGDRMLHGSAKDQASLERHHGFSTDPRLLERGARESAGETREEQRHVELISTLRGLQEEIASGNTRITRELRLLDVRLTSIESSAANLNMGALMAALVAGGVALAPDDIKRNVKNKVDGVLRPNGPNGAAATTALAVSAPTVAPEGPRLNVFGEPVPGAPLTEAQLGRAAAELNEFLAKLRTPAG